jgi:hypothetical protein
MERLEKIGRRTLSDRRKHSAPLVSRYTFTGGRRRTVRRKADRKRYIIKDSYSSELFIAIFIILTLTLADSYFTLKIIHESLGIEANPIMAFYLGYGNTTFILVKFFMTAKSLILLFIFRDFSSIKHYLATIILIYFAIILYQLNMIYKLVPRIFN